MVAVRSTFHSWTCPKRSADIAISIHNAILDLHVMATVKALSFQGSI